MGDFRRNYADAWFNELAGRIDTTRDDNEARHVYWQTMSARNWANNEIDNLANYGLVFLEMMFKRAGRNDRDEDIIAKSAEEWIKMDLADFVLNDRDLERDLDRDMHDRAKALARDREYIMRDIVRALEAEERDERRGRDRDGYRRDRDSRDDRNAGRSTSRFGGSRNDRDNGNRRAGGFAAAAAGNARGEPREEQRQDSRQSQREERRETAPARQEMRTVQPVRRSELDGPDFTQARPFDEFWIDGECWRPAHKSGWTARTPEAPFPVAYNINTHLKFHVMDKEGKVREELMNSTNDNAYLKLDIVTPRQAERMEQNSRAQHGEGHRAPGQTQYDQINWANYQKPAAFHDRAPTVGNMNEGDVLAQFTHSNSTGPLVLHKYSLVTLVPTDLSRLQHIEPVAKANNLTDAVEKLDACKNVADPALWDVINERLTEAVNNAMRNAFGITSPKRISDFYGDYKPLLDHFRKAYGESFARTFNVYTRRLVANALNILDEDILTQYLSNLFGTDAEELNTHQKPSIVGLVDFYVVATVDFSMEQLGIILQEHPQEIDQETHPHLYGFVENLFKLTPDDLEVRSTYFLTSDRQRVEVIRSGHNQSMLLIRKF